jgi:hypothetical protein
MKLFALRWLDSPVLDIVASSGCFLHCVSLPFLSTFLPQFFGGEWLEIAGFITIAVIIALRFKESTVNFRCIYTVILLIGTIGIVYDIHLLLHGASISFAFTAVALFLIRRKKSACCNSHSQEGKTCKN